jgi:hypothetical protein
MAGVRNEFLNIVYMDGLRGIGGFTKIGKSKTDAARGRTSFGGEHTPTCPSLYKTRAAV